MFETGFVILPIFGNASYFKDIHSLLKTLPEDFCNCVPIIQNLKMEYLLSQSYLSMVCLFVILSGLSPLLQALVSSLFPLSWKMVNPGVVRSTLIQPLDTSFITTNSPGCSLVKGSLSCPQHLRYQRQTTLSQAIAGSCSRSLACFLRLTPSPSTYVDRPWWSRRHLLPHFHLR